MKIHDTLSGKKHDINTSGIVGIYLCGVTVYDRSHIGHARTVIIFDILRRHIESSGSTVEFVQNFTDVDDKIIDRAKKEGVKSSEISSRYIQEYHDVFDRLNVIRASQYPTATEHISEMQDMIKDLQSRRLGYVTKNGVYFAVSGFPNYGKLSKKSADGLQSGARVSVDEDKKNPLDFALWKFSDSEPSWDSPWGKGRPGWHIECSAMSLKYLGKKFAIHGGGRDLIFPHHENEIAQSESHTESPMADTWMHVGMVTIDGQKMSKSLGNIRAVTTLLERWSPNIIRLFCIGGHYSKPIDYSEDLLKEHESNWARTKFAYYRLLQSEYTGSASDRAKSLKDKFDAALSDDLNTHLALGAFYELVTDCLNMSKEDLSKHAAGELDVFRHMIHVLGLQIRDISKSDKIRVESLVLERNKLRDKGMYKEADHIRDMLASENIRLNDESGSTVWVLDD